MTFDSGAEEQGLVVHKGNGSKWVFRSSKNELYSSDIVHDIGAILEHTVDGNESKYSVRQYSNAKKHDLCKM